MKEPKEIFETIYRENRWGSAESRSGNGSEMRYTAVIRRELPLLLRRLGVTSLLDIPCGDCNWMKEVDLTGIKYIGADIVPDAVEHCRQIMPDREFLHLDLITDLLPSTDAVFCRDCLGHLTPDQVLEAICNIKYTCTGYLITTTFPGLRENYSSGTGGWRYINPAIPPYNLGEPVEIINEGWGDKSLGVWRIHE